MLTGRETVDAYSAKWNLWDAAEHIGSLVNGHGPAIERPVPLTRTAARLTRFADCAICGCSVNDCECDPDEYAAALYDRLRPSTLENRRDG